jgi:hypothetical protein
LQLDDQLALINSLTHELKKERAKVRLCRATTEKYIQKINLSFKSFFSFNDCNILTVAVTESCYSLYNSLGHAVA